MNEMTSFSIQNSKQIVNNLSLLFKNKCFISVHFGTNNESYMTTLLSINENNNELVLNCSFKEILNDHLLNSGDIKCNAEYKGIKISFAGTELKKTSFNGGLAFSIPIPKILVWIERREYYRAKIPLLKPGYCQLVSKNNEVVNFKLRDISLSGFSMFNDSKSFFDKLNPGTTFTKASLMLSNSTKGTISFEIRNNAFINPDKVQKVGCQYTKLSACCESSIQSYIQQVQRENFQSSARV